MSRKRTSKQPWTPFVDPHDLIAHRNNYVRRLRPALIRTPADFVPHDEEFLQFMADNQRPLFIDPELVEVAPNAPDGKPLPLFLFGDEAVVICYETYKFTTLCALIQEYPGSPYMVVVSSPSHFDSPEEIQWLVVGAPKFSDKFDTSKLPPLGSHDDDCVEEISYIEFLRRHRRKKDCTSVADFLKMERPPLFRWEWDVLDHVLNGRPRFNPFPSHQEPSTNLPAFDFNRDVVPVLYTQEERWLWCAVQPWPGAPIVDVVTDLHSSGGHVWRMAGTSVLPSAVDCGQLPRIVFPEHPVGENRKMRQLSQRYETYRDQIRRWQDVPVVRLVGDCGLEAPPSPPEVPVRIRMVIMPEEFASMNLSEATEFARHMIFIQYAG
jgi:hypothetical protein